MPFRERLLKAVRILVGFSLIGLILYAASLATRDCTVGLYVFSPCLWVWVREHLGLPDSKLLRSGLLELVGLALAAGLYLTIRYVLPRRKKARTAPGESPLSGSLTNDSR